MLLRQVRCHLSIDNGLLLQKSLCNWNRQMFFKSRMLHSLSRRCGSLHHHKLFMRNLVQQIDFEVTRSHFSNKSVIDSRRKGGIRGSTPSSINLVAISTGGSGTSRCLLLTTEHSSYMFNCGEGCQRFISLDKKLRSTTFAKLTDVDNVFITHKSWDTLGGLLGVALTKSKQSEDERVNTSARKTKSKSADNPPVHVYGPEGIEKIRTFLGHFADKSDSIIVKKTGEFEDNALKITPVIFHEKSPERNWTCISERASIQRRNGTDSSNQEKWHGNEVYGYICKVKPRKPRVNIEKCVDAGITIGPMVGLLQRGFPVTLEDGRVIHPSQVSDTINSQDRSFLVIDCPSQTYFPSIEESSVLKQYRGHSDNDNAESFCLVVHMTPADVFNLPYYRKWMEGFGADTDHLVMNEEASSTDIARIQTHQAYLNFVNAEVFPMLSTTHESTSSSSLAKSVDAPGDGEKLLKHLRKASYGLVYTIRGKEVGFHVEEDNFDLAAIHEEIELDDNDLELLSTCPDVYSCSEGSFPEYPKVVFLGTGSSSPSAYRSQSFILVHINEESVIILDCGEDSYGQLYRFYGAAEAKNILRKVKGIFISHLHGDHHLGLVTLLKQRKKAFDELSIPFEPTIVSSPIQMRRWFKFYQKEIEQISHLFQCIYHQKFEKITDGETSFTTVSEEYLLEEVGLKEFIPVEVIHPRKAYGLVIKLHNSFKLVYSGDTRPCLRLAKIGENCDLLIHEATHDDSLLHLAMTSKHSTFSEAIEIGAKMKAKHIILTHFSQRYTHMIPLLKKVPSNIGVAFDNMQVSPKIMPWLSKFIPALTTIFDDRLQINIKAIRSRSRRKTS